MLTHPDQTAISPAPPPFEALNPDGAAPILLVCDHASRLVPPALDQLGLADAHFDKHIAYDIGAQEITRLLSVRLDAPAILGTVSRLVVDLNRAPGDPGSIPEISDSTPVPGNQNLTGAELDRRIEDWFRPYHAAVTDQLARMWRRGDPPAIFSVHSFTPTMGGQDRIWDIGVLWNRDPRMARILIEHLNAWGGFTVGDNEPYSGKDIAYTLDRHAGAAGLPNVAVEIRQDHVETEVEAHHWADILAGVLREITAEPNLFAVEHF